MRYKFIVRSYLPLMAETYINADNDKAALQKFNSCNSRDFDWKEDEMRHDRITYEVVTTNKLKVLSEVKEAV